MKSDRRESCITCGEPKHLQCDLCHPHCYFRCAGSFTLYLRRWYLPNPVGPNKMQGWRSQYLSVCEAHVNSGVLLAGAGSGKILGRKYNLRSRREDMSWVGKHWESQGAGDKNRRTPEYVAWTNMAQRCENPSLKDYKYYGGKGVKVAAVWRDDYLAFLAHVGRRPTPDHSLDRYPNKDGDYEPGNVRWATETEQQRNRRNTILVEVDGKNISANTAADSVGLKHATVKMRIYAGDADPLRPLDIATYSFEGETLRASEIVTKTGITSATLHRYLKKHDKNAEEAIADWRANGQGKNHRRYAYSPPSKEATK